MRTSRLTSYTGGFSQSPIDVSTDSLSTLWNPIWCRAISSCWQNLLTPTQDITCPDIMFKDYYHGFVLGSAYRSIQDSRAIKAVWVAPRSWKGWKYPERINWEDIQWNCFGVYYTTNVSALKDYYVMYTDTARRTAWQFAKALQRNMNYFSVLSNCISEWESLPGNSNACINLSYSLPRRRISPWTSTMARTFLTQQTNCLVEAICLLCSAKKRPVGSCCKTLIPGPLPRLW